MANLEGCALTIVESSALIACQGNSQFVSLIRNRDELPNVIENVSGEQVKSITIATGNKKVAFRPN